MTKMHFLQGENFHTFPAYQHLKYNLIKTVDTKIQKNQLGNI